MIYELWHTASGNMLESFDTEFEALEAVRGYAEANSLALIHELSLSTVTTLPSEIESDRPPTLAGRELVLQAGLMGDTTQPSRMPPHIRVG